MVTKLNPEGVESKMYSVDKDSIENLVSFLLQDYSRP